MFSSIPNAVLSQYNFYKVHPAIGERALLVMRRHLELLAGPLVILALADGHLSADGREEMGRKLYSLKSQWTPGAMHLQRAAAPPDLIQPDGDLGEGWLEVKCSKVYFTKLFPNTGLSTTGASQICQSRLFPLPGLAGVDQRGPRHLLSAL